MRGGKILIVDNDKMGVMDETLNSLKQYLINTRPLGITRFTLTELGSGEYNRNYLLQLPDRKLVVRVSVSQLSGDRNQLQHEYNTLQYLQGKQIAPDVYFIDMAGFIYPLLIEEYIEGQLITIFDRSTLREVGSAIARLNTISIESPHPFDVLDVDYDRDIAVHKKLYDSLTANEHNQPWFDAAGFYIDRVKTLLVGKNPAVQPMLIRRDANPSNFVMTDAGMRLVDWEITRVDDPTITLASFINEVMLYDVLGLQPTEDDMTVVKHAFSEQCPISDFETLLQNRLVIERLGGLVWALERFDSLLKTGDLDRQKMMWYGRVADKSSRALATSFS